MRIRFYIDPATGEPHIYGHNVTEDEAAFVLMFPGEDRQGENGVRVALGQTVTGRYLKVVYIPDEELESFFIITAYDLYGKPLSAYRRRRRKGN